MSDRAIARALRAGSLFQLNGHTLRHGRGRHGKAVDSSRLDEVATILIDELVKAGWPAITLDDLRSESKLRRFVRVRFVLWWLLRKETKASYPTLAAYLGREDHTSAMYGKRQAAKLIRRDEDLKTAVEGAVARLGAKP